MNRALTEGRQALAIKLAGIHGGIQCAKLAPQLSALADGEASAEDFAALRPHLGTCLSCGATLEACRGAPARVAALVPAAALASDGAAPRRLEALAGTVQDKVEALLGGAQRKAAALGERAHAAVELATGQKWRPWRPPRRR